MRISSFLWLNLELNKNVDCYFAETSILFKYNMKKEIRTIEVLHHINCFKSKAISLIYRTIDVVRNICDLNLKINKNVDCLFAKRKMLIVFLLTSSIFESSTS